MDIYYGNMSTYKERFLLRHQDLSEQDRAFAEWVDEVETIVKNDIGLGLMDITDMPYYQSFEMGVGAEEMAMTTIENFYGF